MNFMQRSGFLLMVLAGLSASQAFAEPVVPGKPNVRVTGNLVADSCTLKAGDEKLDVAFLTMSNKDLYVNKRSQGKLFSLHLLDCDPDIAKALKVTFYGDVGTELPGLLLPAIKDKDGAAGFAIGMETESGKALPFNETMPAITLDTGNNTLNFKAYVQATPQAIEKKSVTLGEYTAIATFSLDYE